MSASVSALCPSCAAPVSASAIACAFCDFVIRAEPFAALAAVTPRRRSAETPCTSALKRLAMRALTRLLKAALVLVAITGAALVGFVALLARDLRHMSAEGVRRTEAALATRSADSTWPAVEALASRSARLPGEAPRQAAPDTAAARLLATAAMNERTLKSDIWQIDNAALARWGVNPPSSQRVNYPYYAAKLLPGAIPDSTRRVLVADTLAPWLGAWRRAAHSAPFPPLWAYKPGFPGVADPYALGVPSFAALKVLAWRNAAAGVLALERGDARTAELRARENIAVAMHLVREPVLLENLIGRVMARDAAKLLSEVGRVSRDSALVGEAALLDSALRYRPLPIQQTVLEWGGMAGDASAPAALRFLSDTTLSPAERASVATSVPLGACQNAREILFGFSARRVDALDSAVRQVALGAPGVARIGELSVRGARAWNSDVASATAEIQRANRSRPQPIVLLQRIGLDGVAGRLTICGYMRGAMR